MRVNIMHIIGTLILLTFLGCKTMTLTEMIADDILHYINNGGDRHDNSYPDFIIGTSEEEISSIENLKQSEVRKMEDLNQITASIGSVIAGIYCIVKTIIAIVKKQRKS